MREAARQALRRSIASQGDVRVAEKGDKSRTVERIVAIEKQLTGGIRGISRSSRDFTYQPAHAAYGAPLLRLN